MIGEVKVNLNEDEITYPPARTMATNAPSPLRYWTHEPVSVLMAACRSPSSLHFSSSALGHSRGGCSASLAQSHRLSRLFSHHITL